MLMSFHQKTLIVRSCEDFQITGKGDHNQWGKTKWNVLQKLDKGGKDYKSLFKVLYSANGIYVLFYGEDEKITSSFAQDFDKIFQGDVFEVFFRPDPTEPVYFEYEVSALDKELVLLMVNRNNKITGWVPWPYENNKVEKAVHISGGEMRPGATIKSWTAELFIPYTLLSAYNQSPPEKGMCWSANFCRLDYDSGKMVKWAWAPINTSFHEIDRYNPLLFD
jgi:hypothetical protein